MQPLTLCKGPAVQSGIPGTGPDSLLLGYSGTENLVPTATFFFFAVMDLEIVQSQIAENGPPSSSAMLYSKAQKMMNFSESTDQALNRQCVL